MSVCDPSVVLALNSGSSSLKFGLYRAGASHVEMLVSGKADLAGGGKGRFHADDSHGTPLVREATSFADQGAAIVRIARLLADTGQTAPAAVGHRVVHGGP